jgi:CheY-like chemotaxis protein
MQVTSQPGTGSCFEVLLPVARTKENLDRAPRGAGLILVADDEDTVRRAAKAGLERHGYQVVEARDGKEAVAEFEKIAKDVSMVLLDMMMPEMSGVETCRALRRIRADVPILLSSGHNEFEVMSKFAPGEVAGFIQKPYSSSRLGFSVQNILKSSQAASGGKETSQQTGA